MAFCYPGSLGKGAGTIGKGLGAGKATAAEGLAAGLAAINAGKAAGLATIGLGSRLGCGFPLGKGLGYPFGKGLGYPGFGLGFGGCWGWFGNGFFGPGYSWCPGVYSPCPVLGVPSFGVL